MSTEQTGMDHRASQGQAVEPPEVIRSRAKAYDQVYARWHAKQVTTAWYEQGSRFFLDTPQPGTGRLNGDEIACALRLLGDEDLTGKTILDCCCGTGITSIYLALRGARVFAFDASQQAIAIAKQSASKSGVANRVCFSVMDAQYLSYPDDSFDAVFCESALHIIIDYSRCPVEMARVLKPKGSLIFCEEALGYNLLLAPIRWLRRRKYRECGGRTLTYADLYRFGRCFGQTDIYHFNVCSQVKVLIASWARKGMIKKILQRCVAIDRLLLTRWPALRRQAGKIVVCYSTPVKPFRQDVT